MSRFEILPCQAMFGMEAGERLANLSVELTGKPCPCLRGLECPLLPPLAVAVPVTRAAELEPLSEPLHRD